MSCNYGNRVETNKDNLREINNYFNSKKRLVEQFGLAGGTDGKTIETASTAADHQLRVLLRENTGLAWGSKGDVTLTQKDVGLSKRAIDRLNIELGKGNATMNTAYIMTQVPSMVHGRLPSSKQFLDRINESTNFERVKRDETAQSMINVSDYLKAAFVELESPSGRKYKRQPAIEMIREFERKIESTENDKLRLEYYNELNKALKNEASNPEYAVINDFYKLMEASNKQKATIIAERKAINKPINQNVISAVSEARKLLGESKQNKQGKEYFTGMAGMIIKSLETAQNTAIKTHLNLDAGVYKRSDLIKRAEGSRNRELKALLKNIDTQITSIKESAREGTYFPHRIFNKISKLRNYLEREDNVLTLNDMQRAEKLSKMNQILSETNRYNSNPDNIKSRSEVLEAMWSKDPISSLDLYINEALTFNRNTFIKDAYVDAIKRMGNDPRVDIDTPKFMKGMRDYMEMQYIRATEGFNERPDWFNNSIRGITGVQVMGTMGFGVLGAARNFLSGYYFHASQGMGVIRRAKNTIASDVEFQKILGEFEKEAGFKFKGEGLTEAAAEGLAPLKGLDVRKIDYRMKDNGEMELIYKGKAPTGEVAERLFSKAVQTSLVFHRIGENALRKNMWRLAFAAEYNRLAKDSAFTEIHGDGWRRQAGKHAKSLANQAINTFAFEYSIPNKAPIISGTAPSLRSNGSVDMSGKDYATGVGSVVFQFLHYPMSFAMHQAKSLRGTYDGLMVNAGLNSPGGRNLMGLAGIYLGVSALSILTNTDLHRMLPNDTKERLEEMGKSLTPPEGKERQYGIISQLTGPTVGRMLWWANYAGLLGMSDNAIERALLGYQDYASLTSDEQEIAKWNQFSVEGTKLMKKTIPNIQRGAGIPTIFQQEFSLYPTSYTKEWRKRINERTGIIFPQKPPKTKKAKPKRPFFLGENKRQSNVEEGLLGLSKTITTQRGRL